MDFGDLPPEVNSARMYAGPGSGPLLAAAAGWDRLAIELRSATDSYGSTIAGLIAQWLGPSSDAMAAAATPFAAWLGVAAAQAEQTAGQARDAAVAYQSAYAATVPPALIAANRAQLLSLLAGNIFGQNAAPIAATELRYGEMWAQDAATMYAYAGRSAAATALPPISPPPQSTEAQGAVAQSAAVAQSTGTSTHSLLSQLMSTVQSSLQSLATPGATDSTTSTALSGVFAPGSTLSTLLEAYEFAGPALLPARNSLIAGTAGMSLTARGLQTGAIPSSAFASSPLAAGLPSAVSSATSEVQTAVSTSAGLGRAGLIGGLSVPPTWAAATPTVRLAAAALQGLDAAGAPVLAASTEGRVFGQMALAGLIGGALGGAVPRVASTTSGSSADADEQTRAPRKEDSKTEQKLKRVLAEMSQTPESVQHWHTDKAHLEALLEQLSTKPGVHAVHVSKRDRSTPTAPRTPWG